MQFALIISGPDAPAPAPRCDGVEVAAMCAAAPAELTGVYDPATRQTWRPDWQSLRDALPPKFRRHCPEMPSLWYDMGADRRGTRIEAGRCVPSLPYINLTTKAGRHVATVYACPVPAPLLEIEICPREGRASPYLPNGEEIAPETELGEAMADCRASGDCEPACIRVRDDFRPRFVIVARNESGEYENRAATSEEMAETARAIYFDSDTDFSDLETCKTYLIWQAASELEA